MKRISSILILAIAASAAWAQSVPALSAVSTAKSAAGQMNKNASQANAALPAGTSKPAAQAAVSKPLPVTTTKATSPAPKTAATTTTKPTIPAAGPHKTAAAKPVATKAEKPAEPAKAEGSQSTVAPEMSAARKRDPFVSPIVSKVSGPTGCSGGKKCLVVDQVSLKGVVKSQGGMIAVIVNPANKAYFMRENDPVYNGFVVKITPDSVVFRETVTDRFGKPGTREVVKKVNAPAV